jgi:DNA-binding transcriptional LysR family regulator
MDIEQLRYFSVLAEYRNMTLAAQRLFISQPALSRRIKTLEDDLGMALFDRKRGSRQLSLTYAGEHLLEQAQSLLAQMQQAHVVMDGLRRGATGLLRVAATPAALRYIVLPALASFRESRPAVEVQLIEAGYQTLLSLVTDGIVDMAVGVAGPPPSDVQWEPLFTTAIYALLSPNHPLATKTHIEAEELGSQKLLTFTPSRSTQVSRELIYHLIHMQNPTPMSVFESTNFETVLGLAEMQVGIALVADLYTFQGYNLRAIPVLYHGQQITTTGIIAWHRRLSETAAEFSGLLEEHSANRASQGYEPWDVKRDA